MLRRRTLKVALASAVLLLTLWPLPALAQVDGEQHTPGGACDHGATAGHGQAPDWDTFFECNGSTQWQRGPYFLGSSSDTCDSNHAGMVQWTGSTVSPNNTFEFCNGSSWTAVSGSASSIALSALSNSTTANTLDSVNYAQTWTWNSLSTQTGFTISTNSALTGGTLVSLQATAASATSTGYVLSISDSTTGSGYGAYSSMSAAGNSGYAIYGSDASASGYAGYFTNTSTGYAVYFNGKTGAALNATASAPTSTNYSEMAGNSNNGTLTTGSTYYYPANGSLSTAVTTEASAGTRSVVSRSGTVQNLYYVANPASTSTITVYHNGSSTAITCSTSNSTSCSDTSDTVSVSAGDQLGVAISATTTAAKGGWSIELAY